jgi:hypothetical protein
MGRCIKESVRGKTERNVTGRIGWGEQLREMTKSGNIHTVEKKEER